MTTIPLYFVTPILGFLRNYIKYKQCNVRMFMRTPMVYALFHFLFFLLGQENIILKTLICERWFFFIDKSIMSLWRNDYMKNKEKYKKKYGLTYKEE